MDQPFSMKTLVARRRLTRAIAEFLATPLKEYLTTLSPLLRPGGVLGEHVQGAGRPGAKSSNKAFQELKTLFDTAAASAPYKVGRELQSPVEILSTTPILSAMEYSHVARAGSEMKTVTVTSPLRWVLTYSGFAPDRLRQLIADPNRTDEELARFVLHYATMQVVVSEQDGLRRIFETLLFPLSTGRLPEFGRLPVTFVTSTISTIRPPDEVILESTEISGRDFFEEIVDLDSVREMKDPFREQLLALIESHGESVRASQG